jgi:hypothetical protein
MSRSLTFCLALLCTVGCDQRESTPTAPSTTLPTPTSAAALQVRGAVVEIGAGPVAGATVSARSCDDTPSYAHVFVQTVSDATGAFRMTIDSGSRGPIGCVYLIAEKNGYQRGSEEPDEQAKNYDNITLRIQRLRRATGWVTEVDSGRAVPGANLSTSGSTPAAAALSDANGFFVLAGVGTSFALAKHGFVSRNVGVPEGQDIDLGVVRFQRAIEISAGASITSQISSTDVPYDDFYRMWDDGMFCSPCKSIDLHTQQRDIVIRVRWSGDLPLTLWAGGLVGNTYNELKTPPVPAGESSVSLLVPATTTVLLVGVANATPGQHSIGAPVPFELVAIAQ